MTFNLSSSVVVTLVASTPFSLVAPAVPHVDRAVVNQEVPGARSQPTHSAEQLALESLHIAESLPVESPARNKALRCAATALSSAGKFEQAIATIASVTEVGEKRIRTRLLIASDMFDAYEYEAGRLMLAEAVNEAEAAWGAPTIDFVPAFMAAYGADETRKLVSSIESTDSRTKALLDLGEDLIAAGEGASAEWIVGLIPTEVDRFPSKVSAARASVFFRRLGDLDRAEWLARALYERPLGSDHVDTLGALRLLVRDRVEQRNYSAALLSITPTLTAVRQVEEATQFPNVPAVPHIDDLLLEIVELCAQDREFEVADEAFDSIDCHGCRAEAGVLLGEALESAASDPRLADEATRRTMQERGRALVAEALRSTPESDRHTIARIAKRLASVGERKKAKELFELVAKAEIDQHGNDIGATSELVAAEAREASYFMLPFEMAKRGFQGIKAAPGSPWMPATIADRICAHVAHDAVAKRDFFMFGQVLQLRRDDDHRAAVIGAALDGAGDIARTDAEREVFSRMLANSIRDLKDAQERVRLLADLVRTGLPARPLSSPPSVPIVKRGPEPRLTADEREDIRRYGDTIPRLTELWRAHAAASPGSEPQPLVYTLDGFPRIAGLTQVGEFKVWIPYGFGSKFHPDLLGQIVSEVTSGRKKTPLLLYLQGELASAKPLDVLRSEVLGAPSTGR